MWLESTKEWSIPKISAVPKQFVDLAVTVMKEDSIDTGANVDDALALNKHLTSILNC